MILYLAVRLFSVFQRTMAQQSEHELWRWEAFFEEVRFLRDCGGQLGSCNEEYVYYAEERLELCVQSVTCLKDHLQTHIRNIPQQNREIVLRYLDDLLECLSALRQEWMQYQEMQ